MFVFFFFFFQAEDGIRDDLVTGVQTCALPIFVSRRSSSPAITARSTSARRSSCSVRSSPLPPSASCTPRAAARPNRLSEIGRASCREKVEVAVGDGALERKETQVGGGRGTVRQ